MTRGGGSGRVGSHRVRHGQVMRTENLHMNVGKSVHVQVVKLSAFQEEVQSSNLGGRNMLLGPECVRRDSVVFACVLYLNTSFPRQFLLCLDRTTLRSTAFDAKMTNTWGIHIFPATRVLFN